MTSSRIVQTTIQSTVTGVILAGGRALRMSGVDKGLVNLAGRPFIEHVLERLRPQVNGVVISANRNIERYEALGIPVVQDGLADFPGPLAGMLSAMRMVQTPYIVTVPCDCPFIPADLVKRLLTQLTKNTLLSVAHDGISLQPVIALIDCSLADDMECYLAQGQARVETWLRTHPFAIADFSDQPAAFININTCQEHSALENHIGLNTPC